MDIYDEPNMSFQSWNKFHGPWMGCGVRAIPPGYLSPEHLFDVLNSSTDWIKLLPGRKKYSNPLRYTKRKPKLGINLFKHVAVGRKPGEFLKKARATRIGHITWQGVLHDAVEIFKQSIQTNHITLQRRGRPPPFLGGRRHGTVPECRNFPIGTRISNLAPPPGSPVSWIVISVIERISRLRKSPKPVCFP